MRIDRVAAWRVVEPETVGFEKSDDFPGLNGGGFGIFEVKRGDEGFFVGREGLVVLLETLDVGGDGVLGYRLSFRKGSSVGHASGQHRDNGGAATLRFRPKDGIEMRA
jgi:hypothetical protein